MGQEQKAPAAPVLANKGSGTLNVALIREAKDRYRINSTGAHDMPIRRFIQTYGLSRDVELALRMLRPDMVEEFLAGEDALREKFAEVEDREQLIMGLVYQLDDQAEQLLLNARQCADLTRPSQLSKAPTIGVAKVSSSAEGTLHRGDTAQVLDLTERRKEAPRSGTAGRWPAVSSQTRTAAVGSRLAGNHTGESHAKEKLPIGLSSAPLRPARVLGSPGHMGSSGNPQVDTSPPMRRDMLEPKTGASNERCYGGDASEMTSRRGKAEVSSESRQFGESRQCGGGFNGHSTRSADGGGRHSGNGSDHGDGGSRRKAREEPFNIYGDGSHRRNAREPEPVEPVAIGRRRSSGAGLGRQTHSSNASVDRSRSPLRPWKIEAHRSSDSNRRDGSVRSFNNAGSQHGDRAPASGRRDGSAGRRGR